MSVVFDENYYIKIINNEGYQPTALDKINFTLGAMDAEKLRRRWICHHQANIAAQQLDKSVAITGFGMSGPPHMGTMVQIFNAIAMQKAGLPVHIILGDLDAYNGKNISLATACRLAKKYQDFILALGFDGKVGTLRNQHENPEVLRTSYLIGRYMEDSDFDNAEEDLHEFYYRRGQADKSMTYRRKLSLNLMTADFIDLVLSEKASNVIVMLGIDEHKYVKFSQKVLHAMQRDKVIAGDSNISALYTKILSGFNGYPKMSKSFRGSGINVCTSMSEASELFASNSGSRAPLENTIYQMMLTVSHYSASALANAYRACQLGGKDWHAVKTDYLNFLVNRIFVKWREL